MKLIIGALLNIVASLSKIFERKQLIDVGKKLAKGARDALTIKRLRIAYNARRDAKLDARSLRDDPNNRD